jgi:hypothetical protein
LSGEAVLLLGHIRDWNFDIFLLNRLTPYPLVAVTETAVNELNLTFSMDIGMMKMRRFLVDISDAYLPNPYHNQLHGADVTQTMYHYLAHCKLGQILGLNNFAILAMLISAAVHDVAHPGVTGKFLVAIGDPLAIQYNDSSPLENMHLATAFALLVKPENNFLEKYSRAVYREFRRLAIEMVLSTDNDRHFTLMEKVESLINSGDAVMSNPTPLKSHTPRLSKTRSAYTFGSTSPTAAALTNSNTTRNTLASESTDSADNHATSSTHVLNNHGVLTPVGPDHHGRRRNSESVTFSVNPVAAADSPARVGGSAQTLTPGTAAVPTRSYSTRIISSTIVTAPSPLLTLSSPIVARGPPTPTSNANTEVRGTYTVIVGSCLTGLDFCRQDSYFLCSWLSTQRMSAILANHGSNIKFGTHV